jgi:DNA-binding transcriptional LysR family regulator
MQMCLCASTNFLAANRVDRISSLEQVDTVNYRIGGRSFPWELRNQQGKLTQISPMARITFDDLGAILEAIEADLAVGWLPRWMISDKLASDALVEILPESLGDGFPIYAVWPQSPVMPVRVRLAIDLIALELPPLLES